MVGYTPTFGGTPVQPSQVSYKSYAFSANLALQWPTGLQDTSAPATMFNDLAPAAAGLSVSLPDATQVSVGTAVIVYDLGPSPLIINNFSGGSVTTLTAGDAKYLLLTDASTPGGVWRVLQFGAGTSLADAALLVGPGLQAIAGLLNWAPSTLVLNTTPSTLVVGNRAQLVIWTGGVGTLNLPPAAAAGDRWLIMVKNAGSGVWTIDPNAAELIDSVASIQLNVGESCIIECQGGLVWYTIGRGRTLQISPVVVLDKNIGGLGASVNLSAGEAASQIQRFTSAPALTAPIDVFYGSTSNFYFVDNATTGAFPVTCKGAAADPGTVVAQGTKAILVNKNGTMYPAITIAAGTVTQINTSARLTGGPITSSGTLDLAPSGVTAGNYPSPAAIAVDVYGRVTALSAAAATSPPIGSVIDFAGAAAPPLWLLCAGQAVSRVTYAALFAVIGTAFGAGDGTNTFNVPDVQGRLTVGKDNGTGRTSGVIADALGAVGGHKYPQGHAHGVNDPGHAHGVNDPGHAHTLSYNPAARYNYGSAQFLPDAQTASGLFPTMVTVTGIGIVGAATGVTVQAAGLGNGENMPPVIVFNKIIFAGA
jgi:microcystin-dependent protein